MVPMPAADLPALEHRLESRLIELERLYEARPRMSDALARAGAGQRIDELLDEIAELQWQIEDSPAETLEDAAVKLRRPSAGAGEIRQPSVPTLRFPCNFIAGGKANA